MRRNAGRPPTEFEARAHGAPPLALLLLDLGQALLHRIFAPNQFDPAVPGRSPGVPGAVVPR